MSVWAEFHPLKSCVIGTLPDPKDIIPFTNLKNRYEKYFTEIINRSRHELDNLEKVLKSFNVKTYRSKQTYPFHNGKTINTPPLAVRDIYGIYGNSLFKGNFAFDWNKKVPESCDHVLDKINFDTTVRLSTNDIFFDGDFFTFDPEKDLPRPIFHPPITQRCGNDIIMAKKFGYDGNELGKTQYINWIKSVNPKAKFHILDTDGHIDSQIFLVRPGLLLTSLSVDKLPNFFDKWEKIYVESLKVQSLHKKNEYRHKKFHPVIAQSFYNFLQTCTEETYFNLNSLSINEHTVLFTGIHPFLFSQLEKKGIDCVAVDMKATTFWDTGVHCVTNELERQGDLENYA